MPWQLAEYQRIRQRTLLLKWMRNLFLTHRYSEHEKEIPQTRPGYANPTNRADVVDADAEWVYASIAVITYLL